MIGESNQNVFWFRNTLRVSQNSIYPGSRYRDSTVYIWTRNDVEFLTCDILSFNYCTFDTNSYWQFQRPLICSRHYNINKLFRFRIGSIPVRGNWKILVSVLNRSKLFATFKTRPWNIFKRFGSIPVRLRFVPWSNSVQLCNL